MVAVGDSKVILVLQQRQNGSHFQDVQFYIYGGKNICRFDAVIRTCFWL